VNQKLYENYVKAIYQICVESEAGVANTGVLARRIGVSAGTASTTIRNLSDAGLVVFAPYEGARLTESGRLLAMRVVRRHRLIELFLTTVLDMDWGEVHEEAELLEHAVSEKLTDRIDSFLGRPTSDPHGDPIPRPDGSLPESATIPLNECDPGADFVVSRVLDQSTALLRYLSTVGLGIGTRGQVHQKTPPNNTPTGDNVTFLLLG
jgi:DtxR family Mn-dependent transcriptional regulator